MTLKKCTIGTIVKHTDKNNGTKRVGHISGLTINSTGQVIPVVKWAGVDCLVPFFLKDYRERYADKSTPIHHSLLTPVDDDEVVTNE